MTPFSIKIKKREGKEEESKVTDNMDDIHRGSQIQFRDKGKKPNYKHGHDGRCTILMAPCDKEFADCVNCERLQKYNERVKQKIQMRNSHKHSKKSGSGSSIGLFITVVIVLVILAYLVYHGYL